MVRQVRVEIVCKEDRTKRSLLNDFYLKNLTDVLNGNDSKKRRHWHRSKMVKTRGVVSQTDTCTDDKLTVAPPKEPCNVHTRVNDLFLYSFHTILFFIYFITLQYQFIFIISCVSRFRPLFSLATPLPKRTNQNNIYLNRSSHFRGFARLTYGDYFLNIDRF